MKYIFKWVYDTQIPLSTSVTFPAISGNKATEGLCVMLCGMYLPSVVYNFVMIVQ